jgi:hypothetical protein
MYDSSASFRKKERKLTGSEFVGSLKVVEHGMPL